MDYDRRHGYRGPEALHQPARRPGRAGRGARARVPGESGQRRHRCRPSCCRRRPTQVRAVLATATGRGRRRRPQVRRPRRWPTRRRPNQRIRRGAIIRLPQDDKAVGDHADAAGRGGVRRGRPERRRHPLADRRLRLRPQQVQPRDAGAAPAGLGVQAVHLFGGAGEGLHAGDHHQRRAVLRAGATRPAARRGSPRTTTASSTARCACAPRSRSRRTSSRSACCRRSVRSMRRTTSRASASTRSCIRPT